MNMFVNSETNVGENPDDSCEPPISPSPLYLDSAATTKVDPDVAALVSKHMTEEFGNAGSRTHEFGTRSTKAIGRAREQVSAVVDARPDDVVFTSGATEANNLAILGIAPFGRTEARRHIISTRIEHKAVLEPLEHLEAEGFEITWLEPNSGGWISPECVQSALRDDTLMVSMMHVNNETGIIQPIADVAELLQGHPAFFHTDAAQSFGKVLEPLRHPRIDMISVSGHKIHGPKGIGALLMRRRDYRRPPLTPLLYGGGQERGLRPGTLPVGLIAGLGLATELMERRQPIWYANCTAFGETLKEALGTLTWHLNGDDTHRLPSIMNISCDGIDSEAALLAWRELVCASNGAACTSSSYTLSHVLQAMKLPEATVQSAVRFSWDASTCDNTLGDLCAPLKGLA